ncbi:F-box protein At5g07610-like [Solanum dulcamara]|uniref:F-box protein At5g07610-like n=1 Tax=Solanum dulcamara TaxID=45834 RepID=UPI0024858B11|nr:F-box protein At5g07610-like [Solanum dulcamara]XP_055805160.1 F-box protein At5g07610-like [Solanum dulcamara]XP_055805161.1 F-box protein At5g07610-like [Solanum dulcamara]
MDFSQADYINDDSDYSSLNIFKGFPSATSTQRHGIHQLAGYGFKADAYQKEDEFPTHIIREGNKKIKDVVKEHVLPFLPAKSLMKFKAVSKDWDKWIASPLLTHQQSFSCQIFSGYFYQNMEIWDMNTMFLSLDHSTSGVPSPALEFLPEVVKILSSCSGLLLCQGSEKYYVCNPATQDWKILPPPRYYHGDEPAVVLAFEPSLRNIEAYYHVVCAFPMLDQPIIGFEIYSSESNSWSCSSAYCSDLENPSLVGGGLFMKGVAYYETKSNEVLAFDVKEEIPAVISLPVQFGRHGSLTQMEGELSYITAYNECENVFLIDIYQGMEMSLKQSVSINLGPKRRLTRACKVLPCVNSDAVAIQVGRFIYFYHIREQKVECIARSSAMGSGKKFFPYINSLAMLH